METNDNIAYPTIKSLIIKRVNTSGQTEEVEYMIRNDMNYGDYMVFGIPGTIMNEYGRKYLLKYMNKDFTTYGVDIASSAPGSVYHFNTSADIIQMQTSWIHCAHSTTPTDVGTRLKLLAFAELGTNTGNVGKPSGKYVDSSGRVRDIIAPKDSDFAKLAYWAYYADHDGTNNKFQVNYFIDNYMIDLWKQCAIKMGVDPSICGQFEFWKNYAQGLYVYTTEAWEKFQNMMADAEKYAIFVTNLNEGKAIEFDKSSKPMQNNDKITGVKFDKYLVNNDSRNKH